MHSVSARMLPRFEPGWVRFALTPLLVCAACAPPDAVGPDGGRATPVLADHRFDPAAQFYVSPTGAPSGDGSFANPWDLATALDGPAAVTPGSTIWLRGGTYADGAYYGGYLSTLTGTGAAPIGVRQFAGERVRVPQFLVFRGGCWLCGVVVVGL